MLAGASNTFLSLESASVGTGNYYLLAPVVADISSMTCLWHSCASDQDGSSSFYTQLLFVWSNIDIQGSMLLFEWSFVPVPGVKALVVLVWLGFAAGRCT